MSTNRTPAEVLTYARENDARMLDVRFADLPGLWQHVTYPIEQLDESVFEDGFGFDGSSIRGWQAISESDMLIVPDPATAMMDPFTSVPTLILTADIVDPITKQHYERDPRWIAKKAENYLQYTGVGDTAYVGAEAEFFIFDNVRFDQSYNYGFYYIDAEEGRWNSGREENNLGYRPRYKEGYFPVPPTDHHQDLRTEMVEVMEHCGLSIECHHHEVATGGQCEIDQKFDSLLRSADNMMLYKYIVRNVAFQHGHTVTFMPKPLWNDNGSGHAHAHEHLEGQHSAVRWRQVRRPQRHGASLHRRHLEARAGAGGDHQPDDEQLQAAGSRLRGASQSGLLPSEPLRGVPHPHVLAEPQGQAR